MLHIEVRRPASARCVLCEGEYETTSHRCLAKGQTCFHMSWSSAGTVVIRTLLRRTHVRDQAGGQGWAAAVTTTTVEGSNGDPSTQRPILGGPGDRGREGRDED